MFSIAREWLASGAAMTDGFHILIVDDEAQIRTLLRRYLVDSGFKVSDAGSGE